MDHSKIDKLANENKKLEKDLRGKLGRNSSNDESLTNMAGSIKQLKENKKEIDAKLAQKEAEFEKAVEKKAGVTSRDIDPGFAPQMPQPESEFPLPMPGDDEGADQINDLKSQISML